MSQPPNGPPPPYGYPVPPASGIAFMPAPVMMPMPLYPPMLPQPAAPMEPAPSQPTYVTNHYYPPQMPQTEQQPVIQPVELPIDWVTATTATAATYSHRAFAAGKEGWDGSPLWVIRAHHNGDFIPGKLAIRHRAAYIGQLGREIPVHSFDILLAKPEAVRWVQTGHGNVPPNAIPAGNTHTGEPLYIARVNHRNSITPGKLHPSHHCAYISFDGQEVSFKQYEVLCSN